MIENKPGALARVVGLFHQRGYNIETLNVGPVFDGSYSRMTVTTRGSENDVEQITKQINKIIDVIKVSDLTEGEHHEYEFIMVKFKHNEKIQKILKNLNGRIHENISSKFHDFKKFLIFQKFVQNGLIIQNPSIFFLML